MFTLHAPTFGGHASGGRSQRARTHLSIDFIEGGHQAIVTRVISGVKQATLNFAKGKIAQHDTSFHVVKALTPRKTCQSHGFTKNDGGGRGGRKKRGRAATVVLGQIVTKSVGGQKDRNLSGGSSFMTQFFGGPDRVIGNGF